MTSGKVFKTFIDDTLPTGPVERTIEYVAPFVKPNREEDYAQAWAFFADETEQRPLTSDPLRQVK